jgi:hypothetical protein
VLIKQDSEFVRGLKSFIQKYRDFREENKLDSKPVIERLSPEDHYGPTEYKLKLLNPTPDRVVHLTT